MNSIAISSSLARQPRSQVGRTHKPSSSVTLFAIHGRMIASSTFRMSTFLSSTGSNLVVLSSRR